MQHDRDGWRCHVAHLIPRGAQAVAAHSPAASSPPPRYAPCASIFPSRLAIARMVFTRRTTTTLMALHASSGLQNPWRTRLARAAFEHRDAGESAALHTGNDADRGSPNCSPRKCMALMNGPPEQRRAARHSVIALLEQTRVSADDDFARQYSQVINRLIIY